MAGSTLLHRHAGDDQSTVDTNGFIAAATLANLLSSETDEMSSRATRRVRWGILGTGIWSAGLALLSESIVDLWHDLGSIGTPALLLPMLGSLFPRLRIRRRSWVAAWMLIPGVVATIWLFSEGEAGYPLGLEPIYVGPLVSVAIRLIGGTDRPETVSYPLLTK